MDTVCCTGFPRPYDSTISAALILSLGGTLSSTINAVNVVTAFALCFFAMSNADLTASRSRRTKLSDSTTGFQLVLNPVTPCYH